MKTSYYIYLLGLAAIFDTSSSYAQNKETATKPKADTLTVQTVNVAFGAQTKKNMTSAVSFIDANTIKSNGLTNISQAMVGTLPGLMSSLSVGNTIAADSYSFLVRGKATNANTAPLIMVDNVERSIEYLDPNEIESISILKDASAQVMYGLRGANGVILVTTKRGAKNNSFIHIDTRTGVQSPEFWAPKLDAYQYATIYNEALTNDGRLPFFTAQELEGYQNNSNPYLYPNVNHQKELLRSYAPFHNYNFSAGGGDKTIRYFSSLGYLNQEGFFKHANVNDKYNTQNKFERFNFRTNLDVTIAEGFEAALDVNASISNNHSPWTFPNDILADIRNTPANAYPLFNEDGSLGGTTLYRNNLYGQIVNSGYRNEQARSLQTTLRLNKTLNFITQGLSANATYSIENFNPFVSGQSRTFAVYQLQPLVTPATYTAYGANSQLSSQGYSTSDYFRRNILNASLNYEYPKTGNHSLSAIVVYNQNRLQISGDDPDWKYQSISSRVSYGFKQKYFAEATAAYSGSSNFTAGNRMGFFPAFSAGWMVSSESFMKGIKAVNSLKIRGSVGEVGNDLISGGRYQYRQTSTASGGYGFGIPNGTSLGSTEGALGNSLISWEKAFKTNIGFDAQLFNQSVELTADYFHERRRDIAVAQSASVPGIIGISLPNENRGVVLNRGIDFSLQYKHSFNNLKLYTSLNGMFVKNKIIELGEQIQQYAYQYRKGNSLDARFGLVSNGIYQNAQDVANGSPSAYSALLPGDIRYVNQNPQDDNVIDARDRIVIGKGATPEIYFGLNIGGSYKAFDFSFLFQGAANRDIVFVPSQYSTAYYDYRWTPANAATATYPRVTAITSGHNNMQTSTFWQKDGSYLRFRNAELGYTFKNVLKLSSFRVYANGFNLATFSKLTDVDPESQSAGYTYAPLARTYTLGIKVKI